MKKTNKEYNQVNFKKNAEYAQCQTQKTSSKDTLKIIGIVFLIVLAYFAGLTVFYTLLIGVIMAILASVLLISKNTEALWAISKATNSAAKASQN